MQTHAHTLFVQFSLMWKHSKQILQDFQEPVFLHLNKTNKHSLELRTYMIHTLVKPLKWHYIAFTLK